MDFQAVELEPLVLDRVLHAGLLEVLDDDVAELGGPDHLHRPAVRVGLGNCFFSSTLIVRCGERLSTVNGPLTRTVLLSSYGWS